MNEIQEEIRCTITVADTVPQPVPDWDEAPEEATHHVFLADGYAIWLRNTECDPYYTFASWQGYVWSMPNENMPRLPVGIDWRTTLTERPGE